MKRFEYLRKTYDNESSLDYDMAKLGLCGWLMCGVVRYNPSPARVQYMVWYGRELGKSVSPRPNTNLPFSSPASPIIGEGVPRVTGDPLLPPVNWPDLTPDENPFENDDDGYIEGLEDDD